MRNGTETRQGQDLGLGAKHDGPVGAQETMRQNTVGEQERLREALDQAQEALVFTKNWMRTECVMVTDYSLILTDVEGALAKVTVAIASTPTRQELGDEVERPASLDGVMTGRVAEWASRCLMNNEPELFASAALSAAPTQQELGASGIDRAMNALNKIRSLLRLSTDDPWELLGDIYDEAETVAAQPLPTNTNRNEGSMNAMAPEALCVFLRRHSERDGRFPAAADTIEALRAGLEAIQAGYPANSNANKIARQTLARALLSQEVNNG